ncbi:MAG: serine/threonine-protein kinase [Planctomycetota bacterium]
MPDLPPADPIEDLIAECLARIDIDGERAVEAVCERHPELAPQVRRGLARLRALGMAGDEPAVMDAFPERLGNFKLLRRLGCGGMGVVYLAEQESLGRRVALKVIRPESLYFPGARDRFEREIKAVAQLEHPGIVPIYTVGEDQGVPYFAMEWVDGVTLDHALNELGSKAPERLVAADFARAVGACEPWPAARASWVELCGDLVCRLAQALHHAHERGVIHRDVKPSNILLARDGRVLLFDFGLALTDGGARLTRTGSQMGSLPYMSPEQLRGESSRIDRRTDVYSLGVVLFELLTLKAPYLSNATELLRKQILEGRPASIRQQNRSVPVDADGLPEGDGLNPERRYQTPSSSRATYRRPCSRSARSAPGDLTRGCARRFAQRRPTLSGPAQPRHGDGRDPVRDHPILFA